MKVAGQDPLGRIRQLVEQLDASGKPVKAGRTASTKTVDTPAAGRAAGASDDLELSPRARELRTLREAVDNSPEVRESLVAQLKQAIGSGQYRIDGTRVAQGLIAESQQLSADDSLDREG